MYRINIIFINLLIYYYSTLKLKFVKFIRKYKNKCL